MAGTLAFASAARGQEAAEIVFLPVGSSYQVGDLQTPILANHWLLPEGHYRSALLQAKTLKIVEPALDDCLASNAKLRAEVIPVLEGTRTQLELAAGRLTAERETTMRARQSALRAWSVTAGIVVGAGAAIAVTQLSP